MRTNKKKGEGKGRPPGGGCREDTDRAANEKEKTRVHKRCLFYPGKSQEREERTKEGGTRSNECGNGHPKERYHPQT